MTATMKSFQELGLTPEVLRALVDLGYEEPTPIQEQTISLLLAGRDVIAQAQTGSGKTAAFGIPMVERVDPHRRAVQGLVLCPTRELAIQVADAIHAIGKYRQITVTPVYGGQPIERQFRALARGVQIVVGTPGRIMDHMRRGTLSFEDVGFAVLDEADEMLDMGFVEDIEFILEGVPAERQTALFSATIPPRIAALARRYLKDPERISVNRNELTVPNIRQTYYEVGGRQKLDALGRILDVEEPGSTIIFCRTKRDVDELVQSLQGRGYSAEAIHGDITQLQRERTLRRFREGQTEVLVATDVAARGLDIPVVSHVINYDVPDDPDSYVHRIGRTGRMGREGEAITLVSPRELRQLRFIERSVGKKLKPMRVPSLADVEERRRQAFKASIVEALSGDGLDPYLMLVDELAEEYDTAEIAAAAIKLATGVSAPGTPAREEQRRNDHAIAGDGRGAEPGMARLFVNIGRQDGVRPGDFVGAIANEAGIPGRDIGAIDLFDTYSFVEVPQREAQRVVQILSRTTIRGHQVNAEIARPR
ncbi:MAG TPA: DEAD/DEAH box helicase [Thermomicrobiales bacterium]|nr:DEAD/DEAH box helicase [Thermomicrobiales bacterium]